MLALNTHWRESEAPRQIGLTHDGGITVLRIVGLLDGGAAQSIRDLVDAVGDRVLIDLAGVWGVDSLGLGALLGAARRIHEAGGVVAVAGARPPLMAALASAGLHHLVHVTPLAQDAVDWLRHDELHPDAWRAGIDGLGGEGRGVIVL